MTHRNLQPGTDEYADGVAFAENVAKLLPPGATFVLLVGVPETDGAQIACLANFDDPVGLVRDWLAAVDDD